MKTEIAFGGINVARQSPQPALAEARPQQRAEDSQQQSGNHQKFAQFVHISKMARERREGNEGFLTRISLINTIESLTISRIFLFVGMGNGL